jgi:hypothetical protein
LNARRIPVDETAPFVSCMLDDRWLCRNLHPATRSIDYAIPSYDKLHDVLSLTLSITAISQHATTHKSSIARNINTLTYTGNKRWTIVYDWQCVNQSESGLRIEYLGSQLNLLTPRASVMLTQVMFCGPYAEWLLEGGTLNRSVLQSVSYMKISAAEAIPRRTKMRYVSFVTACLLKKCKDRGRAYYGWQAYFHSSSLVRWHEHDFSVYGRMLYRNDDLSISRELPKRNHGVHP